MKKRIAYIIDNIEYVSSNCFQHQLMEALSNRSELVAVTLNDLRFGAPVLADGFISCLRQRTLFAHAEAVGRWLCDAPLVVYDQDPWQAFMSDSPYAGAYDKIVSCINVKSFALTTRWWVDFLNDKGYRASFVRMWVLPKYCNINEPYLQRPHVAGFVGSVHPRRRELLDVIEGAGIGTKVTKTNTMSYAKFLKSISNLKCFVHNEDMLYKINDGSELNFNTGMWVKDIEAASQGCYSIRGKGEGSETYLDGIETVMLYDDIKQVPDIIRHIEKMDPDERQRSIDRTVEKIRAMDVWNETANTLIRLAVER